MKNQEEHLLKEVMLTPEFIKQFKNSKDLNTFVNELFNKGMEQMLEGEFDGHLGYQALPESIKYGNSGNEKPGMIIKIKRGKMEI